MCFLGDLWIKLFKCKLDFNFVVFKCWFFLVVLYVLFKNVVFYEGFKYIGKYICIDMFLLYFLRLI